MATNVRVQVMLSPKTREKLEKLAEETGLPKAAVVTIALEKYWKEVMGDEL